jgi:hypothetical protein
MTPNCTEAVRWWVICRVGCAIAESGVRTDTDECEASELAHKVVA